MEKKGISMIVLVITIVVMIILAGAVILALSNSGIIGKANLAKVETDLSALSDEVNVKRGERELKDQDIKGTYKLSEWGITNSTYEDRVIITAGELRVRNTGSDDEIEKAATKLGIILRSASTILPNTKGENLVNYRIYGNSVQDGTPSPANPVEIKSLGDLVTDTKDVNYGMYKIPIRVGGKNLLKTYGYSTESINSPTAARKTTNSYGTTISTTDPVNGVTVTQSTVGNSSLPSSYLNGYFCIGINDEIKYNHKYKLSFDIQIIDNPLNSKEAYFMSNGSNAFKADWSTGKVNTEFTWLKNSGKPSANFLELRCEGASFKIWNIMITEVENDYTYEEYREPTITNIYLKEPLRKVEGAEDYIDFNEKKVVRKVNEMYLTENDGWVPETAYGDYYIKLTKKNLGRRNILCSDYVIGTGVKNPDQSCIGRAENKAVSFYDSTNGSTLNAWKEFLTNRNNENKPIYLQYELETPIEESIKMPNIATKNGTTVISVVGENGVGPSNIEVEY